MLSERRHCQVCSGASRRQFDQVFRGGVNRGERRPGGQLLKECQKVALSDAMCMTCASWQQQVAGR